MNDWCRLNPRREFFKVDPAQALSVALESSAMEEPVCASRPSPIRPVTEGAQRTIEWMEEKSITMTDAAARFGVHRSTLWRWLSGKVSPNLKQTISINRAAKVPYGAWGREAT
jgi:DNA-binding XRE family transcriptional regulator